MPVNAVDYNALGDAARSSAGLIDHAVFTEVLIDAAAADYRAAAPDAELVQFVEGPATFLFALSAGGSDDRTILAVGRPDPPNDARDVSYQRGYPLSTVIDGRPRDRGHFIPYSAGGGFGPNVFNQDRALNRGWSMQGRRYRALERTAVACAPDSLMFVRAHYADCGDVPATVDVGVTAGPRLQHASFRNRFDDASLGRGGAVTSEVRLAALLEGATDAQIGAWGEETAAVLLEEHHGAVTITMGDAALPRRGGRQDLDLVVMIDGELVVYEVKTRCLSAKAGRLTRAGNLSRPRLRRPSRAGGHRQGSQGYVATRLDDVIDTAVDFEAVTVRLFAVDFQLMLAQEFTVDDAGRHVRPHAAPIPCRDAATVAMTRILAHRASL